MFKYYLKFREPGYHKENDLPFIFPPNDVNNEIDSNLIEIRGKNGTGKTTLLNVFALALGYQNNIAELENKMEILRTLNELNSNNTLEYNFEITSEILSDINLKLFKSKGHKNEITLNNKSVSLDSLKDIDIVYLTEDDPEKVINHSKKKIIKYFMDLEKSLEEISSSIYKEKMNNDEYFEISNKIQVIKKQIGENEEKIETLDKIVIKDEGIINKINRKSELKEILDIISEEKDIKEKYEYYYALISKYKSSNVTDINEQINNEEKKINRILYTINHVIDQRLIDICKIIKLYNINVDIERILDCDELELEKIRRNINLDEELDKTIKFELVEDMISLFNQYDPNEEVPLINKRISETVNELNKLKNRMNFDRVYILMDEMDELYDEKNKEKIKIKKIDDNIQKLYNEIEDFKNINYKEVREEFKKYEIKYIKLQSYSSLNKSDLLEEWHSLTKYTEQILDIKSRIDKNKLELNILKRNNETLNKQLNTNKEKLNKKPKYYEYVSKINKIDELIIKIRERVAHYLQILNDPENAKEYYNEEKMQKIFSKTDYQKFYNSIGKYLGNLFEPVNFANALHNIEFFDIEKNEFITSEGRNIKIKNLSQGQNKITALTPSLKRLGLNKKGIILIDEIADLDYENLSNVKKELKEAYKKGNILLAILVRPLHEQAKKDVEIVGW